MKNVYRHNPLAKLAYKKKLKQAELLGMYIGVFFQLCFISLVIVALLKFIAR
jgi:hypothetical protein